MVVPRPTRTKGFPEIAPATRIDRARCSSSSRSSDDAASPRRARAAGAGRRSWCPLAAPAASRAELRGDLGDTSFALGARKTEDPCHELQFSCTVRSSQSENFWSCSRAWSACSRFARHLVSKHAHAAARLEQAQSIRMVVDFPSRSDRGSRRCRARYCQINVIDRDQRAEAAGQAPRLDRRVGGIALGRLNDHRRGAPAPGRPPGAS